MQSSGILRHVTSSMCRPIRFVKRPLTQAAAGHDVEMGARISGGRRNTTFPRNSTAMWLGTSTTTIFVFSYIFGVDMSPSLESSSKEQRLVASIRERHHRFVHHGWQTPKVVQCDAAVSESQVEESSHHYSEDLYNADLDDADSSGYTEEDRFYECVTYHRSLLHDYLRRWGPRHCPQEDAKYTENSSDEVSPANSKSRWPRNVPNAQEVTALECDLFFCERNPKHRTNDFKACQETKFQIAAYYASPQNDDRMSQREKGFLVIKELAEQGYADAMCYYGNLLSEGTIDGVESNPQQAVVWWRRCVDEHGHINAMYEFATACYLADGIPENAAMAVSLFRRAAHLGHAGAAYMLGECLLNGVGAERDRSDALEWLVTAAELGHLGAQDRVLMILNKDYGSYDKTEAAKLRQQQETLKWLNYDDQDSHAKTVNIERRFTIGGGSRNPVVVARRKSIVEESRNDQ